MFGRFVEYEGGMVGDENIIPHHAPFTYRVAARKLSYSKTGAASVGPCDSGISGSQMATMIRERTDSQSA